MSLKYQTRVFGQSDFERIDEFLNNPSKKHGNRKSVIKVEGYVSSGKLVIITISYDE